MGNRTSTCLMYHSCYDKINYRFIELWTELPMRPVWSRSCRLARRQIDWPARLMTQEISQILLKMAQAKVSFLLKTQKRRALWFLCVIKKMYQGNIPFVKTIHMCVFIKGIIGKMNCYWHVRFFFNLYWYSE